MYLTFATKITLHMFTCTCVSIALYRYAVVQYCECLAFALIRHVTKNPVLLYTVYYIHTVVSDVERSLEEKVKGDISPPSQSSGGAVLDAVLLLLSQLKEEELQTVKGKVQQLLSQ